MLNTNHLFNIKNDKFFYLAHTENENIMVNYELVSKDIHVLLHLRLYCYYRNFYVYLCNRYTNKHKDPSNFL